MSAAEGVAACHRQASVVGARAAQAVAEISEGEARPFRRAGVGAGQYSHAPLLGQNQGVRAVCMPDDGRPAAHVHVEAGGPHL